VATVYGFLKDFGLEREVKVNIEQGHAILAGHSFEHEIATAAALGIFGSIDMNRNDYQSGWDTDQFPNNHAEKALAFYEILRAGGYSTGGTNFDAKIRRQSLDAEDLVLAHVGGMDTCARALKSAAALLESGELEAARAARYAGWTTPAAKAMLAGGLEAAAARVAMEGLEPEPKSGRQERLENLWNRFV
jgi:xylose isomerase